MFSVEDQRKLECLHSCYVHALACGDSNAPTMQYFKRCAPRADCHLYGKRHV